MDKQQLRSGNPSPFHPQQTLFHGRDHAESGGQPITAAAAGAAAGAAVASAGYSISALSTSSSSMGGPSASGGVFDQRLAPRPRRSWETTFQATSKNGDGSSSGDAGPGATAATFSAQSSCRLTAPASAYAVEAGAGNADTDGGTKHNKHAEGMSCSRESGGPASGAAFSRNAKMGAGETSSAPNTKSLPSATPSRVGGSAASDDDLTDTDEGVMARLAEFTEMARRTAVHNEELSRELSDEKKRVAHTTRKLEQSNINCAELRESLALAQETVIKLREHEMAWAESTASEMSLRSEMCALKDEYASVSGDVSVLRKRCDELQRENTELGERFATIAEEKRQVESRARRLLRSDRYRGY